MRSRPHVPACWLFTKEPLTCRLLERGQLRGEAPVVNGLPRGCCTRCTGIARGGACCSLRARSPATPPQVCNISQECCRERLTLRLDKGWKLLGCKRRGACEQRLPQRAGQAALVPRVKPVVAAREQCLRCNRMKLILSSGALCRHHSAFSQGARTSCLRCRAALAAPASLLSWRPLLPAAPSGPRHTYLMSRGIHETGAGFPKRRV